MIGLKRNELEEIFDNLKELVLYKDAKYNGAADSPLNIFTGKHKFGYRIDDKLKRIQTSPELRKNDRSDTIVRVKSALGYTKDTTPYFTEDLNTFVINYKGTNKLDNTNGNITKDLLCSIEQYKQLCSTSSGQKTTAPSTNTTSSTPIELKYLNDYATAVGNGIPEYGTCKSLFDYYSEQALNYRRLKKVNKAPNITKEQLQPIKDKILYCQKSSDLKDRAKLDTLISQRFRIQQDKDSPYYVNI